MSGFPNYWNGADGTLDPGDFSAYTDMAVRQRGDPFHPWNKQTTPIWKLPSYYFQSHSENFLVLYVHFLSVAQKVDTVSFMWFSILCRKMQMLNKQERDSPEGKINKYQSTWHLLGFLKVCKISENLKNKIKSTYCTKLWTFALLHF